MFIVNTRHRKAILVFLVVVSRMTLFNMSHGGDEVGDEVRVSLDHPESPARRYSFSIQTSWTQSFRNTFTHNEDATVEDVTQDYLEHAFEMACGTIHVGEVDPSGQIMSQVMYIDEWRHENTEDELGDSELKDTVITVKQSGATIEYRVDGRPPSGSEKMALRMLVPEIDRNVGIDAILRVPARLEMHTEWKPGPLEKLRLCCQDDLKTGSWFGWDWNRGSEHRTCRLTRKQDNAGHDRLVIVAVSAINEKGTEGTDWETDSIPIEHSSASEMMEWTLNTDSNAVEERRLTRHSSIVYRPVITGEFTLNSQYSFLLTRQVTMSPVETEEKATDKKD